MNLYNIQTLKSKLLHDKEKKSYVVIPNIGVDFRELENSDIDKFYAIGKYNESTNYSFDDFFIKLNQFCLDLSSRNIPFDSIHVSGQPGIIITSQKHREILEKYMKEQYDESIRRPSESYRYPSKWNTGFAKSVISNLKIEDTLYNYVPLKLSFEPISIIDDNEVSTNKLLGLSPNDKYSFETTVLFNEFINELNKVDWHLEFDADELKSYKDYFNHMKKVVLYLNQLSMDIDLDIRTKGK